MNKETIQRALGLIEGICRAAELPENIQSALFDALETIDAALQEPTQDGTIALPCFENTQPFPPPQKMEGSAQPAQSVTDPLAVALLDVINQLGIDLQTAAKRIGTREVVLETLIQGGSVRKDSREKIDQWVRAATPAGTAQE